MSEIVRDWSKRDMLEGRVSRRNVAGSKSNPVGDASVTVGVAKVHAGRTNSLPFVSIIKYGSIKSGGVKENERL